MACHQHNRSLNDFGSSALLGYLKSQKLNNIFKREESGAVESMMCTKDRKVDLRH